MDILVISGNKLPHFIEEFFKQNKVYFFTARGSIQCQSILNTKRIQRIFFFYTRAIQKIEKDIIQVLNQKLIPVVLLLETQEENLSFQKSSISQHYCDIFLDEPQTKILDKVLFFLQPISGTATDMTIAKKTSNYLFKNYFAKFIKKKSTTQKTHLSLPLASYLEVSNTEKEILLKNLSKTSKKKIKDLF